MTILSSAIAATVGMAIVVAASPADATTVTTNYSIALSDFADMSGSGATPPFANLNVNFTITLDPEIDYFDSQDGLVINSFVGPTVSNIVYTYVKSVNLLALGGLSNGVDDVETGTDDFGIFIDTSDPDRPTTYTCGVNGVDCGTFSGDSTYAIAVYTLADRPNAAFFARSAIITTAVPEPATWAMLFIGFGLIGSVARHRRWSTATTQA